MSIWRSGVEGRPEKRLPIGPVPKPQGPPRPVFPVPKAPAPTKKR